MVAHDGMEHARLRRARVIRATGHGRGTSERRAAGSPGALSGIGVRSARRVAVTADRRRRAPAA